VPELVISGHFVTRVTGTAQCGYRRPDGRKPSRFFSTPSDGWVTRASREMVPEESDFLVFEPLGQKMTYRTISAATIRSRPTAPFSSALS